MSVSRESVRRLMLEKQLITERHTDTLDSVYHIVDRLGCLQIDTINVVERAHYLTLWSRLGTYNREHLHQLAYEDRKLFEHWAHGVCYIPFKDYRFYLPQILDRRMGMHEAFSRRSEADLVILDEVLSGLPMRAPYPPRTLKARGLGVAGGAGNQLNELWRYSTGLVSC